MSNVTVLGAGMVGAVVAADLAGDPDLRVTLCDVSAERLKAVSGGCGALSTRVADLSDPAEVRAAVEGADAVAGALPSSLGLGTLRTVIEAGLPYCDISFMPEDPLELDVLAKARGVPAVVDCGVAPGLSHMLAAEAARRFDRCESIDIFVGGLPAERRWPYEYKAGFSPRDVIEEYTRPARLVEHGRVVTRVALSEVEHLEFAGIGTLEAFNTDGLRSLLTTLDVPQMREKTLRYPGHAALMRVLREMGLFGETPIAAGGVDVRPIDLVSALLFPSWTFEPGEADLTVMRIEAEGAVGGAPTVLRWDLVDRYDPASGYRSMSRTTGFPCAAVTRCLLDGSVSAAGVIPPERLPSDVIETVVRSLANRGVVVTETGQPAKPE